MAISKVKIKNFKSIRGTLSLVFRDGVNIIVGNNDVGKTTILEAVHLAFTGMFQGRPIRTNLSDYVFNQDVVSQYLADLGNPSSSISELPQITIEVFLSDSQNLDIGRFDGDFNSEGMRNVCGFTFRIALDKNLLSEYRSFCDSARRNNNVSGLPLEYYTVTWDTFARNQITPRGLPFRTVLIDSANYRYHNGSDLYVHQLMHSAIDKEDMREAIQAHRSALIGFQESEIIKKINSNIKESLDTEYSVSMASEVSELYSVENSLAAHLDEVPFAFAGKGRQCIAKTDLALFSHNGESSPVVLLEEPESHLSPVQLSKFMGRLSERHSDKQLIVSTHSSFVANKLGLDNLILMSRGEETMVSRLDVIEGIEFFKRLPGYDTLRIILADRVVLVEGASDELIFQRAFRDEKGVLPIQAGVDVISVGVSFKRFIPMIEKLKKRVAIITDNDGRADRLEQAYAGHLPNPSGEDPTCCVFFEKDSLSAAAFNVDDMTLNNYSTLEPYLLKYNSVDCLRRIYDVKYSDNASMLKYMVEHKVDCAISVFENQENIKYPDCIKEAIKHVS